MIETKILISSETAEQTALEMQALKNIYGKNLKVGTITRRQTEPYPPSYNSNCTIYRDETGELAFPITDPTLLQAVHPADQMGKLQQQTLHQEDLISF